MKRSEVALMVLQIPLDFFLLLLAGLSAFYLRFLPVFTEVKPVLFHIPTDQFVRINGIVALLWIGTFAMLGLYTPDPNRKLGHDLTKLLVASAAALGAVATYLLFAQQVFDSRFLVLTGWLLGVGYVAGGRIALRGFKGLMYRDGIGLRRVVIFGDGELAQTVTNTLVTRRELGYRVIDTFPKFSKTVESKLVRMNLDEVIFLNPRANEKETLAALEFCRQHHLVFKYSADVFSVYSTNMVVHPLAGVPIVEIRRTALGAWGRVSKRFFDVVFSVCCLVIISPLMAIVALIIAVETGRPIIYKNERVGLRGRRFMVYKFRSMYQKDSTGPQFGASGKKAEVREQQLIDEQNTRKGPIYKVGNDPRVTPFGRFIRRWSIDELPQFINVLKGDMSVVGPRPHQPREVTQYEKEYREVFILKPGITGLAQISGRSDLPFEDEIKLDIFYTEQWSLWLDLIIVIKTPFILFKKRKAE